jgi:hypothetical protein
MAMTSFAPKRFGRRALLRGIGSASTAAIATTAMPFAAEEGQAYDPGEKETRGRYRADSAEVQAFYRTNRYETLER